MRQLLICAGLLVVPVASNIAQQPGTAVNEHDLRLYRLRQFFQDAHSTLHRLGPEFLEASERNSLDWRLLPAIALVETSAGKTAIGNNIFGWDSGRKQFASLREAIRVVASRLGQSELYRGKDLDQLLATYNPRPQYARLVRSVMNQLGPSDKPKGRPVTEARLSPVTSSQDTSRPEPTR